MLYYLIFERFCFLNISSKKQNARAAEGANAAAECSELFNRTYEYCQRFARFKNKDTIKQVKQYALLVFIA